MMRARTRPGMRFWLLAVASTALVAGLVGGTYAAFTATTANPGNTFSANATFPPAWVRHVGSASCGGASSVVTVPAGGIPVGRTLIVQLVLRGNNYANAVAASDARGNAYSVSQDSTRAGSSLRSVVFSAYVATALQAGDSITVTHGNASAEGIAVDEVRRVPSAGGIDVRNGSNGSSNRPTVGVTTTAGDRLVYGTFGLAGTQSVTTEAAGFSLGHDVIHNCGGATARARSHAAYRIVATNAAYTYDPQLNGSVAWVAAAVAYKG